MRRPLLLTGGPASGKTSTGRRLAAARPRAAFVDTDDVRQLVVAGHAAPWQGEEGERQRVLGVHNAIALARNLAEAGFEVAVADVLTPASAALWRESGVGPLIVHLRLTEVQALQRAASRPRWITDDEFHLLHDADRIDPPPADLVLDVGSWTPDEQLAAVETVWSDARRTGPARRSHPLEPSAG